MQYCSLQHWTLLPSLVTSTSGRCFHFGSVSSLFLELFLHSSSVAYWAPINLGSSSFTVIFFAFSYSSWGSQGKNTEVVCHVDHVLSELSTMTCPSCVALHDVAHSFFELDKTVIHLISWLIFCDCGFQSVCPLVAKNKRIMEPS